MILPNKHLPPERCLLTLGAEILALLDKPRAVSGVWDHVRQRDPIGASSNYGWFVLALDLLYAMGAIKYERGLLSRIQRS